MCRPLCDVRVNTLDTLNWRVELVIGCYLVFSQIVIYARAEWTELSFDVEYGCAPVETVYCSRTCRMGSYLYSYVLCDAVAAMQTIC